MTQFGPNEIVDRQAAAVSELGSRFDVVFDTVNKISFGQARRLLTPGGIAVTVQRVAQKPAPEWLAWTRGGRKLRSVLVRPNRDDLTQLATPGSTTTNSAPS